MFLPSSIADVIFSSCLLVWRLVYVQRFHSSLYYFDLGYVIGYSSPPPVLYNLGEINPNYTYFYYFCVEAAAGAALHSSPSSVFTSRDRTAIHVHLNNDTLIVRHSCTVQQHYRECISMSYMTDELHATSMRCAACCSKAGGVLWRAFHLLCVRLSSALSGPVALLTA